ncbi:2422_t:CDS:2, partial [Cetraspora pellucida]
QESKLDVLIHVDGWMEINLPSISSEVNTRVTRLHKDRWKTFGCQDDGKNTLTRLIALDKLGIQKLLTSVLPFQRFLPPEQQRSPRYNSSEDTLNNNGLFPRLTRPKRTAFIDSNIINISHAALIANWIKHKLSVNTQVRTNLKFQTPSSIPYSFNFYIGQIKTFTIIGGFTSKLPPLNFSKIVNDHESFIFSGYFPFMFSSKYIYYGNNAIKLDLLSEEPTYK